MVNKNKRWKEENAEGCCFRCKDGGLMRVCDFKDCLKAYHPSCVKEDDSFLETNCHWTCCYHYCFRCGKSSKFRCFCCPIAVCGRCLSFHEFAVVKRDKGFCEHCSKLAFLIEENADGDCTGEKIDFKNREMYESFFLEYYKVIKEKEGLNSLDVRSAHNFFKNAKKCDMDQYEIGVGGDDTRESEDGSNFTGDDLNNTAKVKSVSRKKRCMKKKKSVKEKVKDKLSEINDTGLSPNHTPRKDKLRQNDLPELSIEVTCNSTEQYSTHFAQCLDKRTDVVGPKTPVRKNLDDIVFCASVEQLGSHSASYEKGTSQEKLIQHTSKVRQNDHKATLSEESNSDYRTFHPAKCCLSQPSNTEFGSDVDIRNLSANRNANLTNDVIVLSDSDNEDTNVKSTSAGITEVENPDIRVWHCIGSHGGRRGPFSMVVLKQWSESDCSLEGFKVWKIGQSETEAIPLTDALRRVFPQYVGKSK